jgi:dienelactone hydrolase
MAKLSLSRVGLAIATGIFTFITGFFLRDIIVKSEMNVQLLSALPSLQETEPPNPYPVYRFSALAEQAFTPQPLLVLEQLESTPQYTSYLVSWDVPELDTGQSKHVTGQLNIPSGNGPFPIVVMLRGYVEREEYTTGVGTKNAADALARNGFITISPDFLGYGRSDPESNDILLARFSRPVVVLQLLRNLQQPQLRVDKMAPLSAELMDQVTTRVFASDRIGIWGHSNGGQIALSILEITGQRYPTTLWAPVSKPFPYSVMYYTDELDDQGKYIRQQLAWFENTLKNNVLEYSILSQPERIIAPVIVHQGGADDAVPLVWSEQLASKLEEAKVDVELYTYAGADHNMRPHWDQVVQRDIQFFTRELKR